MWGGVAGSGGMLVNEIREHASWRDLLLMVIQL